MFSEPHLVLITVMIIVFNLIGLFGNINVIIATVRVPGLRSKAGYLMAILCTLQTICLISELGNLRVYWSRMAMAKEVCFRMIAVYIFSMIAQSLVYFALSLDMLIAIVAPLRHRVWPTIPYVIIMCIPPGVIAGAAWVATYFGTDHEVQACRPVTAATHHVIMLISVTLIIANTAAVVMIVVSAFIVRRRERELRSSRHRKSKDSMESATSGSSSTNKMVRVLTITVAVFVFTWYFCTLSVHIALRLGLKEAYMDYVMTFNMTLAMLTYCQNYYVLWFRSPRHRREFAKQLSWMKTCSVDSLNRRSSTSQSISGGPKASAGVATSM